MTFFILMKLFSACFYGICIGSIMFCGGAKVVSLAGPAGTSAKTHSESEGCLKNQTMKANVIYLCENNKRKANL